MTSVHWTHLPCVVWNTLWIKIVSLIIDDGVARCRMFSTIAPSFISVRISIYSHRLMNNFFIKVKSSTFYKHLQHVKWKYYLVLVSYTDTALKRQMYARRSKIDICYYFHSHNKYFHWRNILKILLGNILWWIKVYWCIAFLQQNFTGRMFCIFARAANIHLLLVMFWWMSYERLGQTAPPRPSVFCIFLSPCQFDIFCPQPEAVTASDCNPSAQVSFITRISQGAVFVHAFKCNKHFLVLK